MTRIIVACPHDPAIRPGERGPEWYCSECAWVRPLFRNECTARTAVNTALRQAGVGAFES